MRNILKRLTTTPVGAEVRIAAEDQVLFEEAGTVDRAGRGAPSPILRREDVR